jgi:hypothetical protein
MIRFHVLVSRSATRAPFPQYITAEDAALAAFAAWCDQPDVPATRPNVYPVDASRWVASDGHRTIRIQILGREA